jgi:hypothetical protein
MDPRAPNADVFLVWRPPGASVGSPRPAFGARAFFLRIANKAINQDQHV